jgi:hypothetical protein
MESADESSGGLWSTGIEEEWILELDDFLKVVVGRCR